MEGKEEIGFIQAYNSPIKFRKSKLAAFLTSMKNKVNSNKKPPLIRIKGGFFY